jgi:hypothetical protein
MHEAAGLAGLAELEETRTQLLSPLRGLPDIFGLFPGFRPLQRTSPWAILFRSLWERVHGSIRRCSSDWTAKDLSNAQDGNFHSFKAIGTVR